MHCFLFQDWVTLRGSTAVQTILQSEDGWLDLESYQSAVFWVDVRECTGPTGSTTSPTGLFVDFQTSPVLDDAYFTSMVNSTGGVPLLAPTIFGGPLVQRALYTQSYTPLAKYLRWFVNTNGATPTATWDVTMRIWVAASYNFAGGGPNQWSRASMQTNQASAFARATQMGNNRFGLAQRSTNNSDLAKPVFRGRTQ